MTDTIPQDILDAAEKALLAYKTEKPSDAALLGHIARAIMAERQAKSRKLFGMEVMVDPLLPPNSFKIVGTA